MYSATKHSSNADAICNLPVDCQEEQVPLVPETVLMYVYKNKWMMAILTMADTVSYFSRSISVNKVITHNH